MRTEATELAGEQLSTIKAFHAKYPHLASQSLLRKLVFNADTNGFNSVVVRLGRKVLLNEFEFFNWLRSTNLLDCKK